MRISFKNKWHLECRESEIRICGDKTSEAMSAL